MTSGTMDPLLMATVEEERRGISHEELDEPKQQEALFFSGNSHETPVEGEIAADVIRDTTSKLREEGDPNVPKLEEENRAVSSDSNISTSSQSAKDGEHSTEPDPKAPPLGSGFLQGLRNIPEATRLFQNYDLNADHNPLAASGAKEVPKNMVKTATDMISNTDSEELKKILEMAFSLNEKGAPSNIDNDTSRSGLKFPQMTPEMVKMSSGEVSDISLEEFQKVLEVASFVNMNDSFSPKATPDNSTQRSTVRAEVEATENSSVGSSGAGSNCGVSLSSSVMDQSSSNVPTTTSNLKVLVFDLENVDCRDQGYNKSGSLEEVNTHVVSPEVETSTDALSNVNDILRKEGGALDMTREAEEAVNQSILLESNRSTLSAEYLVASRLETGECSQSAVESDVKAPTSNAEHLYGAKDNPGAIGLSQNHVLNADPDSLAALGIGGISAEIIRTATDMFCTLEPEELQKIFEVAFSLNVKGPIFNTIGKGSRPGLGFPEMTPETVKMASEQIIKMAPEELQKMLEVAPSLNMDLIYSPRPTNCSIQRSKSVSELSIPHGTSHMGRTKSDKSYSSRFLSTPKIDESSTILSTSTVNFEESFRYSIKDPAFQQMFTSMMNDMSPEMMTNRNEQLGLKLSMGNANDYQDVMPSISEDDLDRMIQQEEEAPQVSVAMEKTTIWFLGKAGLNLAFCMLILACIFHKLGYIRG